MAASLKSACLLHLFHKISANAGSRSGLHGRCYLPGRLFSFSSIVRQADETQCQFDEAMLKYLVCPLSKKPLRYDAKNNELISDELQVAYPIVNGIPNLLPQDARRVNQEYSTDIPKDA